MLITPWHRAHDIRWNRSHLVPIEFKSGPSYVKHTIVCGEWMDLRNSNGIELTNFYFKTV